MNKARRTEERIIGILAEHDAGTSAWRRTRSPSASNRWRLDGLPPISGYRAARELTTLIERRGRPGTIVPDNGTELTSSAILRWCAEHRIE